MSAEDQAAKEVAIAARETAIAAKEAAFAELQAKHRRNENLAFAEKLASEGRVLPRQQVALAEFLCALPEETSLNFSEGDTEVTKPASVWFKNFLTELPVAVDFTEKSAPETPPTTKHHKVAVPDGYRVDPKDAAKHQAILSYAETNKVDFVTAALAVDQQ